MVRTITGALWLALIAGNGWADDQHPPQVVCTVDGCKEITLQKPRFGDANAFSVQQVWGVVDTILAVSGLLPNFQVVETYDVANAAAVIIDEERFLAFNPDWLAQYESDPNARWQLYGVIAHEIGHHLQGHTITAEGSRPPTELEADEYAGFVLAALGASLTEAQSLWATLPPEGSSTHPPQHQRLAAVERGWLRRNGSPAAEETPVARTVPPLPDWLQSSCTVTYVSGQRAKLCFSSVLEGQGSSSYEPENTLDRDHRTAWVEGASGDGIGEAFALAFDEPTTIQRWGMRNGYAKSDKTFTRNGRVRKMQIAFSNGGGTVFTIDDTPDWQETTALAKYGPVDWVVFGITEVFPGTRYEDTAITELSFD